MKALSPAFAWSFALACAVVGSPGAASGAAEETPASLKKEMADLKSTVRELATTVADQAALINALQNRQNAAPRVSGPYPGPGGPPVAGPAGGAAPSAATGPSPAASGGLAALNPQIGVVGDVVGNVTTENSEREGADQFTFRELELVFGGYVDPYSRGDFAIVLNEDEGIEIEEAFWTRYGLPHNMKAQVGKFRSKFGKINLRDLNALPSVNEPLVIQDFLGPEGFSHTGVRLQGLIPNPRDWFLEGTVELVNGEPDDPEECRVFCAGKNKPIFNSHLKSYFDLTDDTSLELGGSLMAGPSQADAGKLAHITGGDITLTHFMPGSKKIVWQNEFMHVSRRRNNSISLVDALGAEDAEEAQALFDALDPAGRADARARLEAARSASSTDAWGGYSMIDYRFHPKWSAGGRADFLRPLDQIYTGSRAWGAAGWITFHQSELALVRLQYQHTDFGNPFFTGMLDDRHRDEVFLQVRFQIGVDRHGLQ